VNTASRDHAEQAQPRKLVLKKETLRQLTPSELKLAAGGWIRPPITWSCPQLAASSSNCPKFE
jgi:hypothetical protein